MLVKVNTLSIKLNVSTIYTEVKPVLHKTREIKPYIIFNQDGLLEELDARIHHKALNIQY